MLRAVSIMANSIRALLVAFMAVCPAIAFATVAGVFQFVTGSVQVVAEGGAAKPARKGTPLSVGETVLSEKTGTAQIKMADGAIIVVQPETRVTVADFHYEGREDGSERVRYRLEHGGFRAITGAIGRSHKDKYLIETPIAQMGVRGTDHESYYFETPQPSNGGMARAGVYNKVNVGLVFIRTEAGEVVIAPNQVGFAASPQDVPSLLGAIPGFFNRSVGPQSRPQRPSEPGSVISELVRPKVTQDVVTTSGVSLTVGTVSAGGNGGSAGSGGGGSGGSGSGGSSGGSSPGTGSVVGFDPGGGASAVRSGVNLTIAPNGATLANTGGDAAWGVDWGTWMGGLATVGGQATNGGTHFMNSSQLTSAAQLAAMPSMMVTATYNYAGGPAPTDQAGLQGKINSLGVGVNFSTQQITSYNLNATVGGATWVTTNGSGTFAQFGGASGIAIGGKCSGCAGGGSPTASGTASGLFVGPAAEKMITSFGLKASSQTISGAGLLAR
jgi:hypothetical protein